MRQGLFNNNVGEGTYVFMLTLNIDLSFPEDYSRKKWMLNNATPN